MIFVFWKNSFDSDWELLSESEISESKYFLNVSNFEIGLNQKFLNPNTVFFESVRLRIFDSSVNARIFEPKYFLNPSDLDFSKIQIFLSPNMGISFCRPWIEACHGFLCKIERYADPRGAQNIWLICCLILAGQFEKVHFPKHKLVSYS